MLKVHFIVNGRNRKSLAVAEELESYSLPDMLLTVHRTAFAGHARALAYIHSVNCDVLVAVGGDGTTHECANGLMEARGSLKASLPVFGVLPAGSGNDFARNFGWSSQLSHLIDRLRKHETMACDIAKVTARDGKETHFINAADIGIGPEVVEKVDQAPAHWSGKRKFRTTVFKSFFTYQKIHANVIADNFNWSGKTLTVAVANGKYFGSGLGIAPEAVVDDGLLDITVVGNVSWLSYLTRLYKLTKARALHHAEVHYAKSAWVVLEGTGRIELDGELGPMLPVEIQVEKNALQLLM
jgi:diacylglycerol kinase (ATP)